MSRTRIGRRTRREVLNIWGPICLACNGDNPVDLHHGKPEYAGGPTVTPNLFPLCTNKLGKLSCHYRVHANYNTRELEDDARGIARDYESYFWDWIYDQWAKGPLRPISGASPDAPGTVTGGQNIRTLARR